MKQIVNVVNTDSVNLYGTRFSIGALYNGLFEECLEGIPLLIAHDSSRIIGWSRLFSLYFEPGLTRLVGIGELAENDDDFKKLHSFYSYHLQKSFDAFQPEINELKGELQIHLSGEEKLIASECIAFIQPDLAKKVFPSLFALQDKDGLIPLNCLSPIGPGVYQIGKLTAFAHPYFRRSLYRLNTLNYPFLRYFQSFNSESAKIALDPDMVGLASTDSGGKEEFAYWWGPMFDDNLLSIPYGVTHHKAEETERIFYGISATQFRWGGIDNHHVFEAEELRDMQTKSSDEQKYGCRYVHSMVSEKTGHVDHLDGSIRMYTEDSMMERLDTDIAHAGRHTKYTKLWRTDDKIPIAEWKRLISDYFRDNYLVGEYFGAEKLDRSIWAKKQDASLYDQYIPYSIDPKMGFRMALSIQPRTDAANSSVRIGQPLDVMTDGQSENLFVEDMALELKKALRRINSDMVFPTGTRFVSFKDLYINLPLIYHPENDLKESIKQSLEAILMLLNGLYIKEKNWTLSYNIAFPLDHDREIRISTYGYIEALIIWLKNPLSCPPIVDNELQEWAEQIAVFLRNTYPENIDHPKIFSILMTSGLLLIERKRIETKNFQIMDSKENGGFEYKLELGDEETDLKELHKLGIYPGLGWLIEESKCDACGQPYEACNCSKILDKGVAQRIEKALPFPFWTDRPL